MLLIFFLARVTCTKFVKNVSSFLCVVQKLGPRFWKKNKKKQVITRKNSIENRPIIWYRLFWRKKVFSTCRGAGGVRGAPAVAPAVAAAQAAAGSFDFNHITCQRQVANYRPARPSLILQAFLLASQFNVLLDPLLYGLKTASSSFNPHAFWIRLFN